MAWRFIWKGSPMAKKLTDDKKLAEIFPPDDLLEYDAWEAAAPLVNNLKGFIDPDPATEEAIAQGKVRERARRATETQEATPVAKLDLRGRRDPFLPWTPAEFKTMPRRKWTVGSKDKPLLIDKGLWATFGIFKSGKTYYSLEQGFCIAHGLPFLGHDTLQGNVAYLLAEGGVESAYERLQALCIKHGMKEGDALGPAASI